MRLNLILSGFFLMLLFSPLVALGQTKSKPVGEVTIEVKDEFGRNQSYFIDIPIYQTLRESLLQKAEGFFIEQSNRTCNLDLKIRAIKDTPENALVIFYIATKNSTKSNSFRRTIKLKKCEKKPLNVNPKLSYLGIKKHSFVTIYQ